MKNLYNIFTQCAGVSTDSRNIAENSMFFALKGESFDGNTYAADALKKGAAFAVVDNKEIAISDRYILVEDVLGTLQHLATYHRRVLGIPILAITGTNGKTTTKELVARVLSKRYRVSVTKGNLNNHIGVPLTLLSIKRGTEFGIIEMGASARGEIEFLCNITQPDFGIITNIGLAHLEGFGSEEGIRAGKGELFDYIAAHNGLIFYLKSDQTLCSMVEERPKLLAKGYTLAKYENIKSNLTGDYNKLNVAAAAAIGEYFGVNAREIATAIESYIPDNNRSQRLETIRNTLILDCYNANPSSMKSAIENFAKEKSSREKIAILGDMLELGKYASQEHKKVIDLLEANNIKRRILIGETFYSIAKDSEPYVYQTKSEAVKAILKLNLTGGFLLLKGSNNIGLSDLTELL